MHNSLFSRFVCFAALIWFTASLRADQTLLATHCSKCHAGNAIKGDFALRDLGDRPGATSIDLWISSLDRVRAGEMPPANKSKLTDKDRQKLIRSLESKIESYERTARTEYATSPRRLNNRELANSLADVLLIDHVGTHEPLANLIGDTLDGGFDTNGEALGISEYHLEQYVDAVRKTLDAVILEGPQPPVRRYDVPTSKLAVGQFQNRKRAERAYRTPTSIDILDPRNRVSFTNFKTVPTSGRYRIKIRAAGIDRGIYAAEETGIYEQDPIRLRVHLGNVTRDYELPDDDVLEIAIDEWLAAGTPIELSYPTDGLRFRGNGNFKFQYSIAHDYLQKHDRKLYEHVVTEEIPKAKIRARRPSSWHYWTDHWQGPRPRIFNAEVEGPFFDAWPPTRTTALLGEAPHVSQAAEILSPIATRAWRREASDEDLAPLLSLVKARAESLGHVGALKEGIVAILVSPSFLLINPGGEASDDLLATKFSYLLHSSTPSDTLRAAVSRGELNSFESVRDAISHRFATGQADAFLDEFPYAWLQLDRINFMAPDPDKYPFYHRKSVSDDMIEEVQHFFRHAIEQNVRVPDLLLANYSFVNADLAKVYGLADVPPSSEFGKYTFSDGRRGGFLGMGAFLTLTADSLGTSPIHRAIYVMENFLGIHPAPPPSDVEITEPDIRSARTIKEVLEAHRSDRTCASCHQAIDPFGYAFENFDPAGGWRDEYEPLDADPATTKIALGRKSKSAGIPIDASSSFLSGAQYSDIKEFRALMDTEANRERFVRCFVTKLLTYANGEEPSDVLAVQRIVDVAAEHDYRIVETVAAVIDSPLFREK